MRKVTIDKLKNIMHLEFELPENNGVYLLVGANGVGKSTLLVCLDRICNGHAFVSGLARTRTISQIDVDQYTESTIAYSVDEKQVIFKKKNARWMATPRKTGVVILGEFGFPSTIFVKADSRRFDVTQEEFRNGRFILADSEIRETLNHIFETKKYSNLYILRSRGRYNKAYYAINEKDHYYSEQRFSTGELAIIRLIESIQNVDAGSMILLDEAEMALHPRIQKNLYNYVKNIANEKRLLVIISTHSTTLINASNKNNILLLEENDDGVMQLVTPCYHAKAIGSVDFEENTSFDYIFFVEDDMARLVLKKMIQRRNELTNRTDIPMVSIVPVAGFKQTAELAVRTADQLFTKSKVYAVLDDDAFAEEVFKNSAHWKKFCDDYHDIIHSLLVTPEVWLIEKLENSDDKIVRILRQEFHCEPRKIFEDADYLKCCSPNARKLAKLKRDVMVEIIKRCSGECEQIVLEKLVEVFMEEEGEGLAVEVVGPMIQ